MSLSMTTSEVESLFSRTVVGDYESEDAWDAVGTLRMNGSREIFEWAAAWCTSDDARKGAGPHGYLLHPLRVRPLGQRTGGAVYPALPGFSASPRPVRGVLCAR